MQSKDALNLEDVLKDEAKGLGSLPKKAGLAAAGATAPGRIGLALSGGGIRSATFSLGVLQALAAEKKLASFDYLSTVSGGGYIGSWLTAWIHRVGLSSVQDRLGKFGSAERHDAPSSCEPAEVTWLRRYSNYLTPRVGVLTLDSLTLIATWSRNFLLNVVVLLGSMACLFAAPHLLLGIFKWAGANFAALGFAAAWVGLLFFFGIAYNLWHQGLPIQRRRNWLISTRGVLSTVVLPGILASSFAAVWLTNGPKSIAMGVVVSGLVAALLGGLLVVWAVAEGIKRGSASVLKELPIYALAAAASILVCAGLVILFYLAWKHLVSGRDETFRLVCLVTFGPSALLSTFGIGMTIFTGLVGRIFFERSREWWSRLNAWLVTLGIGWTLLGLLTFFSLPALEWLISKLGNWISLLGTGWLGSLLATVFLRKPESGSKTTQLRVDRALNAAAAVFVAGLLFAVAATTQWALLASSGSLVVTGQSISDPASTTLEVRDRSNAVAYRVATPERREASIVDFANAHIEGLRVLRAKADVVDGIPWPAAALLTLVGVTLLFGWRVDINKFSLHNMYKNRLVRCYLGASNQLSRNEQPFTGLDDADDIPLRDLVHGERDALKAQRPLHIINTALNITQGANLAWQERKAASFVFTPLYCGYSLARTQGDSTSIETANGWDIPGFRPTSEYATKDREEQGFKLGMALATSGAAVSPNMGHASSAARAFVLTMFNVRLGRWSSNPAGTAWKRPSPRFGVVALLQELLGYSNERRNYVYLSDGGHFDNLGVYELVRRRCSVVFVVDAGADPTRAFGDLADTIRKCRVDMGVEISFPELKVLAGDRKMRAEQGFTKGIIHYDSSDRSKDGTLILIKPTLTRGLGEPVDIQNYAAENPPFPQQTTGDQFFDESQFESYRRLGAFIAHACLKAHSNLLPEVVPVDKPRTAKTVAEFPAAATRVVARVFSAFKRPFDLPKRDGALLDFFFILLLLSVLFAWSFKYVDPVLIGDGGGVCFRAATCSEHLTSLYSASDYGIRWDSGLLWRTMMDNVFILVYALTFLVGFIVGTETFVKGAWGKGLRWVLWALPVATACVDYAENFAALSTLVMEGSARKKAVLYAPLTVAKFVLFTACLCALLALTPWIVRAFKRRWSSALSAPSRFSFGRKG
jgi:predicted acylesterase/phospholipase RssA